jgi:hypothetical protein
MREWHEKTKENTKMKSGTIKSSQRDAAGVVRQLPLSGNIRESGVGPTCPPGAHIFDSRESISPTANGAAVICNIAEQSWILHRTHGTFVIAGRAPGETFALTIIGARTGAIDLGDKRTLEFPITAREIAADLAREINSDGGEGSYFGVFVCAGDEPDEAELADAHAQLDAFYRNLVAAADKEWERTHSVVFISDLQRRAARGLKLEKEWSYEPQQRMDCPACGEKLKPGVAVCRVCGAVLDRAKAAQFGLVASTQLLAASVASTPPPPAPAA